MIEERLNLLWLESPVKLWLNGSSLKTVNVSYIALIMQTFLSVVHILYIV